MAIVPGLPKFSESLIDKNGVTAAPWYRYFSNLAQVSDTTNGLQAEIDALKIEIDAITPGTQVRGQLSIAQSGNPAPGGIITLTLVGDTASPGNHFRYGTDGTGSKGWQSVSSDFASSANNILKSVSGTGVVSFSIDPTYVGQTSITTLGTITTGTWNATTIAATRGGTGQSAYATGDILYASATNTLSRLPASTNGFVLTLAGGIPVWAAGGGGSSPLTTKGDLYTFSTVNTRLPVGTDGFVLTADSTQATGLKWASGSGGATIGVGTYASAPASPSAQTLYQCTDCPLEMIYDGTKWNYFVDDTVVGLPTALTTWVNQGGATVNNYGPFQAITAPLESGTVNIRARVKSLAASSNYTVTARIDLTNVPVSTAFGGLCLYDSGSGKFHIVAIAGRASTASGNTPVAQTLNVSKFTNASTFSADYIQYPLANPGEFWLRIKDDGTNRISSISYDGFNWIAVHSVGRTDFLTPNSVGYFAVSNNNVFTSVAAILSFTETSP